MNEYSVNIHEYFTLIGRINVFPAPTERLVSVEPARSTTKAPETPPFGKKKLPGDAPLIFQRGTY
jgi:hypothetical protein